MAVVVTVKAECNDDQEVHVLIKRRVLDEGSEKWFDQTQSVLTVKKGQSEDFILNAPDFFEVREVAKTINECADSAGSR